MLSNSQFSYYSQFSDLRPQYHAVNASCTSSHHSTATLKRPNLYLHTENKFPLNSKNGKYFQTALPIYPSDNSSDLYNSYSTCPLPSPPLTKDSFFSLNSPTTPSAVNYNIKSCGYTNLTEVKKSVDLNTSNVLPCASPPAPIARLGSSNFGTSNPHFESLKLNPPRQVTISEDLPTLPSFSSLDLALFPSGSSALQFPSSPPSSRINKSHSPPACPRRPLSMFQLPTTSSGLPPLPPPLSRSRSSINMLPTSANGSMENSNLFLENPPTRQEFVSSPLSTLLYAAKELSTLERLNHATFSTPLIESTMGISSSPLSSSPTSVPRHFDLSLNSEVFNSLSPLSGTSSSSDFSQSSSPTCSFTSLSNATSKLDPTPSYSSLKTFSSTSPKETLPTFTNSEKRRKGFFCPDCGKLFSRAYNLKSHMKTHTSERPFKCDHCTKAFARKQDCLRHMRIHTNDRPFSCHRCATSFSRQDALSRHEYTCFGSRSLYSSISLSAHTAAVKNSTSNSSDTFSSSFQTKTKPQYKKQSIHSSDSGVYSE